MPAPPTIRSRWTAYASISVALAGGVVLKALCQRPNFYSAAVYLSQSSANLMILCNLVFVTACSFLFFLGRLLFGTLRPIEVEQLYEKGWFAVTELCLAMTIFRGEIGAWFGVMFFSLLAGKVWGWIGEGRIEVLEQQPPRNPRLFHTRLALSLSLSVLFNVSMLEYVVDQVLHMARPDMMVMFGFEFAVLSITSLSTATRYALNLIEIGIVRGQKQKRIEAIQKDRVDAALRELQSRQAASDNPNTAGQQIPTPTSPTTEETARLMQEAASQPIDEAEVEVEGWEAKGRWVFYLDLATDFLKLVVYISFFFILLVFYGLPLHIMRDVFLTCRSFVKRIGDFMRYRTATRDMHERYPDATEAEIGREDVCIICREDMRPYVPPAQGEPTNPVAERMRPKKLPCGHVLHFSCLRSWLERQQICPTCRATVVPTTQTQTATAANVAQGAAGVGQQRDGQPARNGPRVYQLGPLRIGVGAARGNNMFEELEQQLANPNPAPNQNQAGNAPQQYGFGIRWDGMRRRREHRSARGTAQEQIDAVERQIQRELDQLRTSTHELQALRNIQAQLNRFRMSRQGNPAQQAQAASAPQQRVHIPATILSSNPQQNLLQAGSEQLPPGLTLPEGWSMMPLQPHGPAPLFPAAQFSAMGAMPNMMSMQRTPVQNIPINAASQAHPQSHARPVHSAVPQPNNVQAALLTSQLRPQPQAPPGQSTQATATHSTQSQTARPSVADQHQQIHQRAHQLAHERAFRDAHQGLNPHSMTTITVNGGTHTHTHSPAPIRPDRSTRHANLGPPQVSGNPIQQALATLPQQVQDAIAGSVRSASEPRTASHTTYSTNGHADPDEAGAQITSNNQRPLPNWDNSVHNDASSSERPSSGGDNGVQRNGGQRATQTPETEHRQPAKKNATVEDLVEDPD